MRFNQKNSYWSAQPGTIALSSFYMVGKKKIKKKRRKKMKRKKIIRQELFWLLFDWIKNKRKKWQENNFFYVIE